MSFDHHAHAADSVIAPAQRCFAVVPDDEAELAKTTKAIYIGTGGNVSLRALADDEDVTFVNLPSGFILDVRVTAIRSTGTTASDIIGLA